MAQTLSSLATAMLHSSAFLLAAAAGFADPLVDPAPPATVGNVAVGNVTFEQRIWGRRSLPSLTFTVATGRGQPEKVAAFLYYSEEPQAYLTSPYPPQFVGVLSVPSSVQVFADGRPDRGPINEFSREKFVQGALFDVQSGALVAVTNEDYLDIAYETPATLFTLDFETEDDLATPLVNGQDLSTPPEFGVLVSLSSLQAPSGPPHQGAAIFDSTPGGPNAGSSDPDLLVGLGNVVILQENPGQSVAGIFDLPDDAANGGSLVFDFTGFDFIEKVEPRALDLVDVDSFGSGVQVLLTDVLGRTRTFVVPSGWTRDIASQGPPGYGTLDLTTLLPQPGFASTATASGDPTFIPGEVVRMEVRLGGSGAIDNLVFAREPDPAFTASGHGVKSPTSLGSAPARAR